jgi:hypothetical protein
MGREGVLTGRLRHPLAAFVNELWIAPRRVINEQVRLTVRRFHSIARQRDGSA